MSDAARRRPVTPLKHRDIRLPSEGTARRRASPTAAAFEAIYRAEKDVVHAYAVSLAGPGATAEDLVHDVFIALLARWDAVEKKSALRAYLIRAVRHRFIDDRRRSARRERPIAPETEPADDRNVPPAERLSSAEDMNAVGRALASLSDDESDIVRMRVWGRLSFEEIGETLAVPPATARTRYRAALERLRFRLRGVRTDE